MMLFWRTLLDNVAVVELGDIELIPQARHARSVRNRSAIPFLAFLLKT